VGWTIRRNHGELARAGRHCSSRSNSSSRGRHDKRGSRVWTVPEDGGYLTTHGFRLRSAADRSRGVRDQPEHRSLNAVCSEMIIDSEARQVDPVRFSEQGGLVIRFCEFGNIRGAGAAGSRRMQHTDTVSETMKTNDQWPGGNVVQPRRDPRRHGVHGGSTLIAVGLDCTNGRTDLGAGNGGRLRRDRGQARILSKVMRRLSWA